MGALVATPVAAFVVAHVEGFRSREPELAAERLLDEESERRRAPRSRRLADSRRGSEPV
jgi:hypothetical protein